VRNRAWILPRYLDCLQKLEYPHRNLEYCFIINDCTDKTPEILEQFSREVSVPVKLVMFNSGSNFSHLRGTYSFPHLARLRNLLLEEFLKSRCDLLFSLDSDILVEPRTLIRLLEDDCDIVSALVCNGHEIGDETIYNVFKWDKNGRLTYLRDFPRDCLFKVDCTGAAYLIKRRVIETYGVRYSAHMGSEDIGFCHSAAKQGIEIYCDGRVEAIHVMKESKSDE